MSRVLVVSSLLALAVASLGCERDQKGRTTTTSAEQPAPRASGVTPEGMGRPSEGRPMPTTPAAQATEGVRAPVLTVEDVGLSTPESVLYDADRDEYLVSNIEGRPLAADRKAFISRIKPDGKVEALKWIESGKNGVTLSAPKGMALRADRLYVADLDTVRIFDRKDGIPRGEVRIPGATMLNGMSVAGDRVIVSDTGMKAGPAGAAEPTGNDAIYSIGDDGKVKTVAKGKDLMGPNGLLATKDKTWVVSYRGDELYSVDEKGKKADVTKLPKGQLDGLVPIGDSPNEVLVSSWESQTVYRGKPGGEFRPVVERVKSPAGIGYDAKRGRLLVPLLDENRVEVFEVR